MPKSMQIEVTSPVRIGEILMILTMALIVNRKSISEHAVKTSRQEHKPEAAVKTASPTLDH